MILSTPRKLNGFDKAILILNCILSLALLLSYLAPFANPEDFWIVALLGLAYQFLLLINIVPAEVLSKDNVDGSKAPSLTAFPAGTVPEPYRVTSSPAPPLNPISPASSALLVACIKAPPLIMVMSGKEPAGC